MILIEAVVSAKVSIDLSKFAASFDKRNTAIRVVDATPTSLRIEYGPVPAAQMKDVRDWWRACLTQLGLEHPRSGAFRAKLSVRKISRFELDPFQAYELLEEIASAPDAGPRRGWAWAQQAKLPLEPVDLPLAA